MFLLRPRTVLHGHLLTQSLGLRQLPKISRTFHNLAVAFNEQKDKKKYVFLKKQKLEGFSSSTGEEKPQPSSEQQAEFNEAYGATKKTQTTFWALAIVFIAVAGVEVYRKRDEFMKWYNSKEAPDAELNIESPNAEISSRKVFHLDKKLHKVTNPNPSSVPGLYVCGNNKHGISSEDSKLEQQLVMKRLSIFDNVLARSVCLGKKSGALVDDHGDLFQWGEGFGGDSKHPTVKGENLLKAEISNDTIYALNSKGEVVYLPESMEDQKYFSSKKKTWLGTQVKAFKRLTVTEPIQDIQCGKEHIVLLTRDGEVYTAATGFSKPIERSWGQFGLPNFSQFDEPPRINEVHNVTLLNKFVEDGKLRKRHIKQIAAGDFFTMCLDSMGRVWAFGKNTFGSIGREMDYNSEVISYPSEVKLVSKYFKRDELPRGISIAAGGDTAFATYASSNMYHLFEKSLQEDVSFGMEDIKDQELENLVHMAWGHGLKGQLGSGHYIHGQYEPTKIKNLNDIKEYNESTQRVEEIGVKSWAVGGSHIMVTLTNNDVYGWGDNEFGQLGNGRHGRVPEAVPMPSLLEPDDTRKTMTLTEVINDRLQLADTNKFQQIIAVGPDTTAVYYKRK
ncbi:hypothetical protein FOA43_003728 [Brettanomyces nanus]|uniref:Uncharacterized protein n=1 Tax=Eeniella nana TaxID=13502 RepID=A0A875S8Z5_EENNA|nr:uncharacterized protein FOA43_003728 [Brettanomyces nanus]QPG76342.1 hypothetical protein FOA43_003728 [Brettanomyces nanus]